MNDVPPPEAARPFRRADVLACAVREEVVLYAPESQTALALNLSAATIWALCDGSRSVPDIARELSELSGTGVGAIEPLVADTIDRLRSLDLLADR